MSALVSLEALAVRAQEAHDEVEQHGWDAVDAAIRAGEALTEAKAAVPHGGWLTWLAENFQASKATAQRYMQLAPNAARVRHLASVREALAELTEARPEPEPPIVSGHADPVAEAESPADPATPPEPVATAPEPEEAEVEEVDAEPVPDKPQPDEPETIDEIAQAFADQGSEQVQHAIDDKARVDWILRLMNAAGRARKIAPSPEVLDDAIEAQPLDLREHWAAYLRQNAAWMEQTAGRFDRPRSLRSVK